MGCMLPDEPVTAVLPSQWQPTGPDQYVTGTQSHPNGPSHDASPQASDGCVGPRTAVTEARACRSGRLLHPPRPEGCRGGPKRQRTCSTGARFGIDDELLTTGVNSGTVVLSSSLPVRQPVTEEAIY